MPLTADNFCDVVHLISNLIFEYIVGDDDSASQKQAILKDNGKIVEKYINSIHAAFLSIDTYGQPRCLSLP